MEQRLSHIERQRNLNEMAAQGVDLLIVGGGITGAGIALEAAARGMRVGLVERGDFASGTSSKSTKLAHGGIRYLPQFDFALVHEGVVERGLLARNAPHVVQPLGFVLPLYEENKRPMGTPIVPPGKIGLSYLMQSGLLLYDLMAGKLGFGSHRRIGRDGALKLAPSLKPEGLQTAFVYFDGQTDDTLLCHTVLRTAASRGALLANHTALIGFAQSGGRITHARVRDALTGEEATIAVNTVINATGAFAQRIEQMAGESTVSIKPAKGVHLTLPREAMPMTDHAVVLPETPDGRLLFLVPWNTRVTVGTTDTKGGDLESPVADDADVQYLIDTVNLYMRRKIVRGDVISSWAGFRPLVSPKGADGATSKLSRNHVVMDGPGGMVTITGGKLTTYRRMAQDAVDRVARNRKLAPQRVTENLPLDGAEGWQAAASEVQAAAQKHGWAEFTVKRIQQYGSEARKLLALCAEDPALAQPLVHDLPYTAAEVIYACRYEMALTLEDMIVRRLHLNFEDWSRGVEPAPRVAQLMARELGWDARETQAQVERYAETCNGDKMDA